MTEKLEPPKGYVFVCVHCSKEIGIDIGDAGQIENNSKTSDKVDLHKEKLEPVAWMDDLSFFKEKPDDMEGVIPLYTHPHSEESVKAQTLTSEEIEAEWFKVFKPEAGLGKNLTNGIFEFARAILKKASEK